MNHDALRALKIETEFLAGVESNFEQGKGKQLKGTIWQTARHDEEAALRAALARNHRHDRALLKQLPKNRRIALHGYDRRWWGGKRRTGVAIASVLAPLDHFATGATGELPPVDLGDLVDHVGKLVTDPQLPHVVGVCSPSGFTEEARNSQLELPNVTLVLIEPGPAGGWRVTGLNEDLPDNVTALFDPEDASQKLQRVRDEIRDRGADLLVGGMEAGSMAARMDLPEAVVAEAFEQAALDDPELKVARKSGQVLLYRGAPVTQEKSGMNVIDKIRALFSGEGDESEKINLLAERRAGLSQRRGRIDDDVRQLESREAQLYEDIKTAKTETTQFRLLNQVKRVQKDIARQNVVATMLDKQIDTISTDIHNLSLIQEGRAAQVPDTDELTDHAVQAEEILESIDAGYELTSDLDTGVEQTRASDEDRAMLDQILGRDQASEASGQIGAAQRTTHKETDAAQERRTASRPASADKTSSPKSAEKRSDEADPESA